MIDNQAKTLNIIASRSMGSSSLRVLTVSSGKGGVGKTNVVANLAYALAGKDKKVLVVDADLGLNNIDILLGLAPRFHIGHVLSGQKSIEEILVDGPNGVKVLPAGDGLQELTQIDSEKKMLLMDELDRVSNGFDYLLFDTGAGISANVTYFCAAAHEILLIATSEPTSLTDVYALIKILHKQHGQKHFRIIINSTQSEKEAQTIFRNLTAVTDMKPGRQSQQDIYVIQAQVGIDNKNFFILAGKSVGEVGDHVGFTHATFSTTYGEYSERRRSHASGGDYI